MSLVNRPRIPTDAPRFRDRWGLDNLGVQRLLVHDLVSNAELHGRPAYSVPVTGWQPILSEFSRSGLLSIACVACKKLNDFETPRAQMRVIIDGVTIYDWDYTFPSTAGEEQSGATVGGIIGTRGFGGASEEIGNLTMTWMPWESSVLVQCYNHNPSQLLMHAFTHHHFTST